MYQLHFLLPPTRTVLLCYLISTLGGCWLLEQPFGSVLEYYPTFRQMMLHHFLIARAHAAAFLNIERYCTDTIEFLVMRIPYRVLLANPTCSSSKVHRVAWWMYHYDAPTPKRHYAWSNSRQVKCLDKGRLNMVKYKACRKAKEVVTAKRFRNKDGKQCYQGTKQLRDTEQLGLP